jgi:GTPase SAR1 family protein
VGKTSLFRSWGFSSEEKANAGDTTTPTLSPDLLAKHVRIEDAIIRVSLWDTGVILLLFSSAVLPFPLILFSSPPSPAPFPLFSILHPSSFSVLFFLLFPLSLPQPSPSALPKIVSGGQEQFKAVTRSYYRNATAVIIVYDITSKKGEGRREKGEEEGGGGRREGRRKKERSITYVSLGRDSFTSVETWLADVRDGSGNDNLNVMLIGNKSDLKEGRRVLKSVALEYYPLSSSIPSCSSYLVPPPSSPSLFLDTLFADQTNKVGKKTRSSLPRDLSKRREKR